MATIPKVDTHWDYVLKEMGWLANDFQKERARHLTRAKKIVKSIDTYHKSKDTKKERKAKEEILQLKKTSSKISKDIRKFWMKIDKIIAFKQKGEFDEIRQKAMDKHLVFLVKQTERYTCMIAENLKSGGQIGQQIHKSASSKRPLLESVAEVHEGHSRGDAKETKQKKVRFDTNVKPDESGTTFEDNDAVSSTNPADSEEYQDEGEDSDEYVGEDELDDETTLIEEENKEPVISYEEEMLLLEQDKEMSVEQLRAMYSGIPDYAEDGSEADADESDADDDDDVIAVKSGDAGELDEGEVLRNDEDANDEQDSDEYVGEDELDDETTLIEEENKEPVISYEEEMALLEQDKEISVEQLRAMYSGIPDYAEDGSEADADESDADDDDDDDDAAADEGSVMSLGSKSTDNGENFRDAMKRLELADEAARSVYVERPYVLSPKLSLREYQHLGLNWLVSLHERRLNGILADEMGLGKTIQTISLLAYLAAYRGLWGPHLIVVPTSCLINWESEFKRFCPIFKVMTYYGSAKARKNMRTGWSKLNSFHVCITSYQLVVQDAKAFRKKRWYYMILDEAHNIKNFKSQRWQTLLNFNTQRRLLLTGTPLQNNLMELWSLMHFLMPYIFRSRKEFSYWFNNPLNSMVEGSRSINSNLISRLHSIMRPFILRRLKSDVAKQLPGKFEHVVMCKLSKRQLFLYEEFMARSSTKSLLQGANYMGMMNILMQLRKVCNHPDLFEPRPIVSPFLAGAIDYQPSNLVLAAAQQDKMEVISSTLLAFWRFHEDVTAVASMSALCPAEKEFISGCSDQIFIPASLSDAKFNSYVARLQEESDAENMHRQRFNYAINTWRCTKPALAVNWRLVRAVAIRSFVVVVADSRTNHRLARNVTESWYDLMKCTSDRVQDMAEVIEKFVFVLPSATSTGPRLISSKPLFNDMIIRQSRYKETHEAVSKELAVFYPARIRQQIFFPDRKLVQFDSGKLQTLCVLLRRLKAEGHKCLIFTQMSKMLDILEVFLNLHAHSYVRLDGSTGIDKRQKLMDRFNNDPKLFCFILSTRSGGLGINLTGADCVIFYDSDWNPAMDAQAQDRAHRIGQTREVHIYRLVCQSTVEENILVKAKQKRHLDFLVMTEGSFSEESLFSSDGLKDILDISGETKGVVAPIDQRVSAGEMEAAMAAAEDAEDLSHMKGLQAEIATGEKDFDENAPLEEDEELGEDGEEKAKKKAASEALELVNEEKALEQEFASWQASVGPDFKALESALKPIERFAMNFHTVVEPFYSMHYISEQQRLESMGDEYEGSHWDVEEIEREKEEEEHRALAEGELLAAELSADDVNAMKAWYIKERSQRHRERKNRLITGKGWSLVIDEVTRCPYWYNEDNGDASYSKPKIVEELENYQTALQRRYNACPHAIVQKIFEFLVSFPDRQNAGATCARWRSVADDPHFHKRVLSVESGARDAANVPGKLRWNDFVSLQDALASAHAGDTIVLAYGHHWEKDLTLSFPVRILSERDDASKCVVELSGQITLLPSARSVVVSGITFRRPRKIPQRIHLFKLANCKLLMYASILNNEGSNGACVVAVDAELGIFHAAVKGGTFAGILAVGSLLVITNSIVSDHAGSGVFAVTSTLSVEETLVCRNKGEGINLNTESVLKLKECRFMDNVTGTCSLDSSSFVHATTGGVVTVTPRVVMLRPTQGLQVPAVGVVEAVPPVVS